MPKGGVSGITQAQLEAAVQAALESPENFTVIKDANEAAIIAAGGGGGDSSLTFPDLVVSGTGPYVIPAGFNAIVRVSCRGSDVFTVNGFQTLGNSANKLTHVNITTTTFGTFSYTVPVNVKGTFYTGYGGSGGNQGVAELLVNFIRLRQTTDSGSLKSQPSVATGSDLTLTQAGYDVAGGDVLSVQRLSGNITVRITGTYWPIGEDSSESQTFILPSQSLNPPNVFPYPQTVINGGSERLVELYAI